MPLPNTKEGLEAAGYRYAGSKVCRGPNCGVRMEIWNTPAGRQLPLDPVTLVPHFGTCPDRDLFKKGAKRA